MAKKEVTTINFFDNHRPVLEDGEYTIVASQEVSVTNETKKNGTINSAPVSPTIESQSVNFNVAGPRFQLSSSLIHTVFPPAGGKGDYRADLPKMVLNRSTLPWERCPLVGGTDGTHASWLFLLLVTHEESSLITEQNSVPLKGLKDYFISSSAKKHTPPLSQTDLDRYPNKINCLEVDPTLKGIFPSHAELQYLSYARIKSKSVKEKKKDKSGIEKTITKEVVEEEMSVVLGNRLPMAGKSSTVYLVSLENFYDSSGTINSLPTGFTKYQIPYFYKWQFHANSDKLYFVDDSIEDKINQTLKANFKSDTSVHPPTTFSPVSLTAVKDKLFKDTSSPDFKTALGNAPTSITDAATIAVIEKVALLPETTFQSLLTHLPGGISPLSLNSVAVPIESSGSVSLSYLNLKEENGLEKKNITEGWYRSPLASTTINLAKEFTSANGEMPNHSSDFALSYSGQTDVTYSTAFELGRLTALDDVDFSTDFFKWKNEVTAASRLDVLKSNPNYPSINHLPVNDGLKDVEMPKHLQDKIESWKKLENIPFEYIVPEPGVLPTESIRFFQIDRHWINSFLCGAFSLGHTATEISYEKMKPYFMSKDSVRTGFIINSMVVSGWPDFLVNAYPTSKVDPLKLVRKDTLDTDMRIYIVEGIFDQLEFFLHPMKTHSGFVLIDDEFTKSDGAIIAKDTSGTPINIASNYKQTIDISKLVKDLSKPKTTDIPVAEFAGKMLEGAPRVFFKIGGIPIS